MKRALLAIGPALILAGCLQNEAVTRSGPGGTEIQISSGTNCFNGSCINYFPERGSVSVAGRFEVPIPGGLGHSDGWVTVGEFNTLVAIGNTGGRKSSTSRFD